ncbi:rhodopsin-like [Macrobrachium rosenbergii]|uniref:rhodopsin-like n=1 Tax=Macrobrachium rosenbergii TaxID=79674 RepID=UPI0034D78F39
MGYWDDPSNMVGSNHESTNPYGNYTVVDRVPRELLSYVDDHWYQYPPMNPLWYSLVGVWMFVMGTLAVSGNFVVIWVFMNTKSLRTPSNLYVVSLAVSDFFMMACMCPPILINCYNQMWSFSGLFCQVYAAIGSICGTASIWAMVFITLDRYNVIVKGIGATPLTTNRALLNVLFIWAQTVFWCVLPFFGYCRYVPEGNMTACGTDYLTDDIWYHIYLWLYTIDCYLLPLAMIIYCYAFILKAVATHEKQMREQAKKMGVKSLRNDPEAKKTSNECRLAKVALTTVSLWFIAWTPYCIINIAGMHYKSIVTPLFSIWGSVFAKANAVYNPIVYAISHPKYRAAMEKKLPCLACTTERDEESTTVSETTSTNEKC